MAKRKLTAWLDEGTDRALRDLAGARGLTISETAAELLKQAVRDHTASAGAGLLVVEVRHAIRGEMRALGNRLAHLLARTALESIAARRELYNVLVHVLDVKAAQTIHEGSWKAAVDALRHPLHELRQALVSDPDRDEPVPVVPEGTR